MINDYLERHYPFEGCFNFRDIGGYLNQEGKRIKKGLLGLYGSLELMLQQATLVFHTLN